MYCQTAMNKSLTFCNGKSHAHLKVASYGQSTSFPRPQYRLPIHQSGRERLTTLTLSGPSSEPRPNFQKNVEQAPA